MITLEVIVISASDLIKFQKFITQFKATMSSISQTFNKGARPTPVINFSSRNLVLGESLKV